MNKFFTPKTGLNIGLIFIGLCIGQIRAWHVSRPIKQKIPVSNVNLPVEDLPVGEARWITLNDVAVNSQGYVAINTWKTTQMVPNHTVDCIVKVICTEKGYDVELPNGYTWNSWEPFEQKWQWANNVKFYHLR